MSTASSNLPPVGPWGGGPAAPASTAGGAAGLPGDGAPGARTPNPFMPGGASPATSTGTTGGTTWGESVSATSAGVVATRAPLGLLYASLGASALALVLAALFEAVGVAAAAWALAALVGLGLTVVYLVRDTRRRASPWYVFSPAQVWVYRASVVLALLAVTASAARIALFVGRI